MILITAFFLCGCQGAGQGNTTFNQSNFFGAREDDANVSIAMDPRTWSGSERTYVELNEDGAGESLLVRISAGDMDGRVRIAWGEMRESVLQVNEDRVVLVGTIDRANDAWTTYEPAPTWLTNTRAQSAVEEKFDVIVHSIRDKEKVIDRGTGTLVYSDEGDQWVRLLTPPTGGDASVRCRRVRRVMKLDLGRADVESETIDWFADSIGLVGEDGSERVKVFGPLGWAKRRVFVLGGD
jgi:hypothetical protein